jgi:hypothetical protein
MLVESWAGHLLGEAEEVLGVLLSERDELPAARELVARKLAYRLEHC